MAKDQAVTIFHNPKCSTSRNVLAAIRAAGVEPTVVEYLKTGWTKPQLEGLLQAMKAKPADILRRKEPGAARLAGASDSAVLAAMVADPILVERPIVVTKKGAALVRPIDKLQALL